MSTSAESQATAQQQPVDVEPGMTASLYVGNLAQQVTEAQLYELFHEHAPVVSVRVCRDNLSRISLGYAYVNFNTHTDAKKARDALNYELCENKPMRIMWSERNPQKRRSGLGNIFIKNLNPEIDERTLHDTFSQFGEVSSVKIARDRDGNSRGFGFVNFEKQESAEKAINAVNGMKLLDQVVYVSKFKTKKEREEQYKKYTENYTNLYVKHFPTTFTEENLQKIFEGFGEISSLALMKDSEGQPRGFGFVAFKETADAKDAHAKLDGKEFEGWEKPLYVKRAMTRSERMRVLRQKRAQTRRENQEKYKDAKLYVRTLPQDVTENELREHFEKYTKTTPKTVYIPREKSDDGKGYAKGYAIVGFENAEDASLALTNLNGVMFHGKPLVVRIAQPKEQRRQMLEARFAQMAQMRNMQRMPMQMQQMMMMNMTGMPVPQMRQSGRGPRNAPRQQTMPPPMMPSQPTQAQPSRQPAPPVGGADMKRQMGEAIYMALSQRQLCPQDKLGKITGMLLEMDVSLLQKMLANPTELANRTQEALNVLSQNH